MYPGIDVANLLVIWQNLDCPWRAQRLELNDLGEHPGLLSLICLPVSAVVGATLQKQ